MTHFKLEDIQKIDFSQVNMQNFTVEYTFINEVICKGVIGRKKGDLSQLNMSHVDLNKLHFHDRIELTGTYYINLYINCEILKLIFEGKIKGLNTFGKTNHNIILENQDLDNLDLAINLIKKYNIIFKKCKFNKKQLLSILKSDISIKLYDKHFKDIDLTNVNLNEINFKLKDIRNDLKEIIFSENATLTPKQTESILNHQIEGLTFTYNYNNTTINPIIDNNRDINLQFNAPNTMQFNTQSNILNNNNNNSLRQMSDRLNKIEAEFDKSEEKSPDILPNK